VPEDYAEAYRWFRKAAEQGEGLAMGYLGFMYEGGHGVPQDDVEACRWFHLAAFRLPPWETTRRDSAVRSRDRIVARMTPAQLAEAEHLVREWTPT